MNNKNVTNYSITLDVKLLEDLHSGTGTGSTNVDSLQFRDKYNNVCIPASHIRGVWLDNAERLVNLGVIDEDSVNSLFNTTFNGKSNYVSVRAKLLVRSLRLTSKQHTETLLWSSSARQPDSRAPQEHSLRTVEYIAAGNEFSTKIELEQVTEKCKNDFLSIVKFTDRFGSLRTRGCGQIKLNYECKEIEKKPLQQADNPLSVTRTLKLLLRNEEPLVLPTTGFPGNIISCDSFIKGRTLQGALTAWSIQNNVTSARDALLKRTIKVSNAYPLPQHFVCDSIKSLSDIKCIPTPLNVYREKPTTSAPQANSAHWPHWASSSNSICTPLAVDERYRDQLHADHNSPKAKRPNAHSYLVQQGGQHWDIYSLQHTIQMRNKRGSAFDNQAKKSDTQLFTLEQIPADNFFTLEIQATDNQMMADFAHSIAPLLNKQQVLRVGRGGSPVVIEDFCYVEDTHFHQTGLSEQVLSITLTSDLIARDPVTLGYQQHINHQILYQLLEIIPPASSSTWENKFMGSFNQDFGFNASSGLPRPPVGVIRRGSVLEVIGEEIEHLYNTLSSRTNQALGERDWEGYGRYILNLSPIADKANETIANSNNQSITLPTPVEWESVTKLASQHAQLLLNQNISISKHKLNQILTTAAQRLKSSLPAQESAADIFNKIKRALEGKRSKKEYADFINLLESSSGYSQLQDYDHDKLWYYMNQLIKQLTAARRKKGEE